MSKTIELPPGIEPLSLDQITPEIRLLASRCILADADSGQFSRDAHKYAAYTIIRERQLLALLAEREQHLGEIKRLKKIDTPMASAWRGAELIQAERLRQIEIEGWTPEHDDEHKQSELSGAALAYLGAANRIIRYAGGLPPEEIVKILSWIPNDWPLNWGAEWWKPSPDPIQNLIKAGALLAAEIDRLQRSEPK